MDGEIRTLGRRVQVRIRRRPAPAMPLSHLKRARADLMKPLKSSFLRQTPCRRGIQPTQVQVVHIDGILHMQWAVDTVQGNPAAANCIPRERSTAAPRHSPSRWPRGWLPSCLISSVAADIDHRVHRRAATEHPAPGNRRECQCRTAATVR